jgi:hypothetical protein
MDTRGTGARPGTITTADPALHLLADGVAVPAIAGEGGAVRFTLPAGAREIRIRSRSAVPAESGLSTDIRRLGVHVSRIAVAAADRSIEIAGCHAGLADGWHMPEGTARWTDGNALLPGSLFAGIAGPFEISLQVARTGLRYPIERPRPARRAVAAAPAGFEARAGVALLASSASAAAVGRFAAEALDYARWLVPGLRLHIYAAAVLPALPAVAVWPAVAGGAIEVHDAPGDLAAALDRHRVLVLPEAAGEAAVQALVDGMASGIAVIAVPELAEAVGVAHERELLVAADHTAFAMALARLHGDPDLWRRLSASGLAWAGAGPPAEPIRDVRARGG